MGVPQSTVLVAGIFFGLILLSGLWLKRSGKPYSVIVLTIHKLISLAAVGFLARAVVQMNRTAPLGATGLALAVATGVMFLTTIVTGGLVSIDRPVPAAVKTLHRVTPILTALSTALTLILLLHRR